MPDAPRPSRCWPWRPRARLREFLASILEIVTGIDAKLDMVLGKLGAIKQVEREITMTQQDLIAKAQAQKTVMDALKVTGDATVAFQQTLKDKIQQLIDAGNNDPALQEVADLLDTNTSEAQATQDQLNQAITTTPNGQPAPLS